MAAITITSGYDRAKAVKEFDESKIGVKGLSDSGIKTIPQIFIHPPQTLSDLKSSSNKTTSIPLIDLSNVASPNHRPNIINQIRQAAKTWGFFQIINHSINLSVLDSTIKAIESFHNQPHETKSKYYKREEGRGVMYASNNDLYRTTAASWHDSLQAWMAPEIPKAEELPEICRKEMIEWDLNCVGVAEVVYELLSEGLGLESGKLKELSFAESRVLVGHCYPYCPQPDLTIGITPHTDPGAITLLLQNQVPGLQVEHGGEWVDVNPVHGGIIVNIGDFLQIISNGEYKSVQHRVLANSHEKSRISIVMFLNLSKWRQDGYHGPLPELVSSEKPANYRDFTQQEFIDNFYSKGIDTKSFIDKVKIQT
ncbi:hypothetical protein RYX36_031864 [Vicia faba]